VSEGSVQDPLIEFYSFELVGESKKRPEGLFFIRRGARDFNHPLIEDSY